MRLEQDDIIRLRDAAASAWGDDTRPEHHIGSPLPNVGQCYVTAEWLKSRFGGDVYLKQGHYYWVDPDAEYALDLTNDHHAYPPGNPQFEGMLVGGEPYKLPEHRQKWQPAPPVYSRLDHHRFKGGRLISSEPHARAKLFIKRANEIYEKTS